MKTKFPCLCFPSLFKKRETPSPDSTQSDLKSLPNGEVKCSKVGAINGLKELQRRCQFEDNILRKKRIDKLPLVENFLSVVENFDIEDFLVPYSYEKLAHQQIMAKLMEKAQKNGAVAVDKESLIRQAKEKLQELKQQRKVEKIAELAVRQVQKQIDPV